MRMYCRNGGVDVADVDALTNARNFPQDWTLKPWIRPDGRADVNIAPDWMTAFPAPALIALARSTFPDEGRGAAIDNPSKAFDAISDYLARTTHPEAKPATPGAP